MENEVMEKKDVEIVDQVKKQERTDSYFDGGLLGLIGWRLLAGFITGITLGIAGPWGQCMLYSYQIKHTVYNGKRLKFEGKGGDLFVNMLKWFLLTIITFGIYALFIPVKKTKWVISHIHFEDQELVENESFFDGKTIQLIGVNLLCNFLNGISLGLLYPFTVCFKLRWINKHTVINSKKLVFDGTAISLFGKYILWCFLTIITFSIYGWWLSIKMIKWQTKNTHIKCVGETEKRDNSMFIAIPIVILAIAIFAVILPPVISEIDSENFIDEGIIENIFSTFDLNDVLSSDSSVNSKQTTKSYVDSEVNY